MAAFIIAGLMLGAATPTSVPVSHSVRMDHHSGAIDARYEGNVAVNYRQVGAVGSAGRPSSLRCMWSADMTVDRSATLPAGSTMSRSFSREGVISGTRAGWCDTHRRAVDREVASRADEFQSHVQAMAAEDHDILRGELDRVHGAVRTG